MSSTSVQIAKQALDQVEAAINNKKTIVAGIQTILNNDPQKWSTTILNYNGNQITRLNLQALADAIYAEISSLEKQREEKLIQYNNALTSQTQSEAITANPQIASQVLDTKNKQLEIEEKAINFAAKNSRVITYVGLAFFVLVVVAGAYKYFTKKTTPAAE